MSMTEQDLQVLERLASAATPGPWDWDTYSRVFARPLIEAWDDAPDYLTTRPDPSWFSDEYSTWLAQRTAAYLADPCVCMVPAHYGDTASHNHAADADFIAAAREAVPVLVAEVRAFRTLAERLALALLKAETELYEWGFTSYVRGCIHPGMEESDALKAARDMGVLA